MPAWTFYLALALALLAGFYLSAVMSVKSAHSGDGILKMWLKSSGIGCTVFIAVMVAFMLVSWVVSHFGE